MLVKSLSLWFWVYSLFTGLRLVFVWNTSGCPDIVSSPSYLLEDLIWLCKHRWGNHYCNRCTHSYFNIWFCRSVGCFWWSLDLKSFDVTQNLKLNFSKTKVLIKKHKLILNNLTVCRTQPEYSGAGSWRTVFLLCLWWFVLLDCKEVGPAVICGVNAHSYAAVI